MTVKKFLVPTDFSENAENALRVAIELAEKVNGEILLLHAYKLIQRAGTFIGVEEMMREDAEKDMAKLLERYQDVALQGIQLKSQVIKGDIESVVARICQQSGLDLVVMGTQGASGLKEVFFGSVTNNVVRKTRVPVLAIPSECAFKPFIQLTLAIDGQGVHDVETYRPLLEIGRIFGSNLNIIHVSEEGEKIHPKPEVMDYLKELSPKVDAIQSDNISEAITLFTKENSSDLLCLVKRDRGFINSLFHVSQTERNVFYTDIPLLILRES